MFFNFSFTRLFSFCLPPCVICRTMIATQQDCVYIRDVKDGMVVTVLSSSAPLQLELELQSLDLFFSW